MKHGLEPNDAQRNNLWSNDTQMTQTRPYGFIWSPIFSLDCHLAISLSCLVSLYSLYNITLFGTCLIRIHKASGSGRCMCAMGFAGRNCSQIAFWLCLEAVGLLVVSLQAFIGDRSIPPRPWSMGGPNF